MNDVYDGYAQRLEQAGVDPADVSTWRQEQLALAEPTADSQGMTRYRLDTITGADVRNVQDENLGSVSQVAFAPDSGEAAYVIVARGGFLGIGEDHYAVPWDEVSMTPTLRTIVVDLTEAQIEEAPSIEPDRFRNPDTMAQERRATDEFWADRG